jgi:hypothetical protein
MASQAGRRVWSGECACICDVRREGMRCLRCHHRLIYRSIAIVHMQLLYLYYVVRCAAFALSGLHGGWWSRERQLHATWVRSTRCAGADADARRAACYVMRAAKEVAMAAAAGQAAAVGREPPPPGARARARPFVRRPPASVQIGCPTSKCFLDETTADQPPPRPRPRPPEPPPRPGAAGAASCEAGRERQQHRAGTSPRSGESMA